MVSKNTNFVETIFYIPCIFKFQHLKFNLVVIFNQINISNKTREVGHNKKICIGI